MSLRIQLGSVMNTNYRVVIKSKDPELFRADHTLFNNMKKIITSILILVTSNLYGINETKLLKSIGSVETGLDYSAIGDHGAARGAFQLHRSAWIDGCNQLRKEGKSIYSYDDWRSEKIQDEVAGAFIRSIRNRFRSIGIEDPTAAQIACVWNIGFAAARRINFNQDTTGNDYSERVSNIYNSIK